MKKGITVLSLLLFTLHGYSQNPNWINFTCGKKINALAQEANFIWAGTDGGLVKIDTATGNTTFYNAGNSGIASNRILALAVDGMGNKWLGTDRGLVKFDGTNWSWWYNPQYFVNVLAVEGNVVWMNSGNNQILKFDGTTFTNYTAPYVTAQGVATSIAVASNGLKWIATNGGGLLRFDGTTNWGFCQQFNVGHPINNGLSVIANPKFPSGNWIWYGSTNGVMLVTCDNLSGCMSPYNTATWPGFPNAAISAQSMGVNDIVWMGTQNHGLIRFCMGTACSTSGVLSIYTTSNSGIPSNKIISVLKSSSGSTWVGTDKGLVKFNGSTWTTYNTSNSGLPDNKDIAPIKFEPNGTAWIGSRTSHGLTSFDGQTWTVYNTANSPLPLDHISALAIEGNGTKWIGTYNGLAKLAGTNWTLYNTTNSGLPEHAIQSLAVDNFGNLWIGGANDNTLAKFNGSTWSVYDTSDTQFLLGGASHLAAENNGDLWIGNSRGLAKFDGINWTIYDTSNSGIPDIYVSGLAIDGSGNKWLACPPGWIAKFDGVNWTNFPAAVGNDIAIDQSDSLWMATTGLAKFDGISNWTNYRLEDPGPGLPHNYVWSIAIAPNNDKWVGTDGGVAVFNETGLLLASHDFTGAKQYKEIMAMPNPSDGVFILDIEGMHLEQETFEVYNILGEKVSSGYCGNQNPKIDLRGHPSGIYLVNIRTNQKLLSVKILLR